MNNLIKSPYKHNAMRRLYSWRDGFVIRSGYPMYFSSDDWKNDKYKDSIILNNIDTLICGYIQEHQGESDFEQKYNKFIIDLIDEVDKLFI